MNVKLPAVILAAGRGERLSGDEKKPPKPLTPVLGLTLLERAILSCKGAGVDELITDGWPEAEEGLSLVRYLKVDDRGAEALTGSEIIDVQPNF